MKLTSVFQPYKWLFLFPASDVCLRDSIVSCCFRIVCLFCMLTHHMKSSKNCTLRCKISFDIVLSCTNTPFHTMIAIFICIIHVSIESHDKSMHNYCFCLLTLKVLWATSWLQTLDMFSFQIPDYYSNSTISMNFGMNQLKADNRLNTCFIYIAFKFPVSNTLVILKTGWKNTHHPFRQI
jgi:hypothetical protein